MLGQLSDSNFSPKDEMAINDDVGCVGALSSSSSSSSTSSSTGEEKQSINGTEPKTSNNKEKSPMCLVNELCRYNGITCQYELIGESGAPHSKTFSVLLKLGDKEEYRANGPSIRKAQHAAASQVLISTKFPLPSPKSERRSNRYNVQLTPTVELNVLAMKRGEPVQYHVYELPQRPNHHPLSTPFSVYHHNLSGGVGRGSSNHLSSGSDIYDFRGMYNQRYHLHRGSVMTWYCATVSVGERQFTGKGKTVQIARHAAAEEALKSLRDLPIPDKSAIVVTNESETIGKSPVSMVYEAAMRRNLTVRFEVVAESGPSHMPSFIVKCIVGDLTVEGQGNGKKIAKRRAAATMLHELKKLGPLIEPPQSPGQHQINGSSELDNGNSGNQFRKNIGHLKKKKHPNSFRRKKQGDKAEKEKISSESTSLTNSDNGLSELSETFEQQSISNHEKAKTIETYAVPCSVHPISRLIQLQQAKKEAEPKFRLISERETEPRKKEFTVECSIPIPRNPRFIALVAANSNANGDLTTLGVGSNKKLAKRLAAEAMLKILGYSSMSTTPTSLTSPTQSSLSSSLSKMSMGISSSTDPTIKGSLESSIKIIQYPNPSSILKSHNNLGENGESNCCDDTNGNLRIRKVKFLDNTSPLNSLPSSNSLINNHCNVNCSNKNTSERFINVPPTLQAQQCTSHNKFGRQLAPGLLFVLDMEQTGPTMEKNLTDITSKY